MLLICSAGWRPFSATRARRRLAIASLVAPAGTPGAAHAGADRRRARSSLRATSCIAPGPLGSVPYRTLGGSVSLFGWMLGIAFLVLLLRAPRARDRTLPDSLRHRDDRGAGCCCPTRVRRPRRGRTGRSSRSTSRSAILAYAAFTFSFVLSILYLIQNRQIRRRQTGLLFSRLPALEVIGRMNRTSVTDRPRRPSRSLWSIGLARASRDLDDPGRPEDRSGPWSPSSSTGSCSGRIGAAGRGRGSRCCRSSASASSCFSYTIVNLYLSRAHSFR